jgi:phasin family protein
MLAKPPWAEYFVAVQQLASLFPQTHQSRRQPANTRPVMTDPTKQMTAWNQAAVEAAMNYARAGLTTAENLLRLNLDAARATLEQNSRVTRELLSVSDPQELMALRGRLAETSMQQAAAYANSVYELVSETQSQLAKMFEDGVARFSKDVSESAEKVGKAAPGGEMQSAALKSTLAATSAMMESLNQATRQFAQLSEATMKAAAEQMVRGAGKK